MSCHTSRPLTEKDNRAKRSIQIFLFSAFLFLSPPPSPLPLRLSVSLSSCARETEKKGFSTFGVQNLTQCVSGARGADSYRMEGEQLLFMTSPQPRPWLGCVDNEMKPCTGQDNLECSGQERTNYVFTLQNGERSFPRELAVNKTSGKLDTTKAPGIVWRERTNKNAKKKCRFTVFRFVTSVFLFVNRVFLFVYSMFLFVTSMFLFRNLGVPFRKLGVPFRNLDVPFRNLIFLFAASPEILHHTV